MKAVEIEIREKLFSMRDEKYKSFTAPLIPNIDKEKIIGVRVPALRKLASEFSRDAEGTREYLTSLPHTYCEENHLHAFLIEKIKDFDECIAATEAFLPYVDNWSTCDMMSPPSFKKHREELLPYIENWLNSSHTYTLRYGIGMLMRYFLDGEFDERYLRRVAEIKSEEYYVKMMIAWYFATALAKQREATLPYLETRVLGKWEHNMTIKKAIESYRISDEDKMLLKGLKI